MLEYWKIVLHGINRKINFLNSIPKVDNLEGAQEEMA